MNPVENELRSQVSSAFRSVEAVSYKEMLHSAYAGNEDAFEMALEFADISWEAIPLDALSRHRESLFMTSAAGFHSYLPAFLVASLGEDATYGPAIRETLVFALMPFSSEPHHVATTNERLAALNQQERGAVVDVLHYLAERWRQRDVDQVLSYWRHHGLVRI